MRKSFRLLLSTLVLSLLSAGLATSVSKAAELAMPAAAGTIAGQVTDDADGTPVGGARVEAFSCADEMPSGSTVTDATGAYLLPIGNGCYHLRFASDGYESSWYGDPPVKDTAAAVTVAGEEVRGIDAPISPAGSVITGRILGEDGKPLAGAWVTAIRFEEEDASISDARSDAKGLFALNVYPGRYFLIFNRHGYVTRLYGSSLEEPTAVDAPAGGKTGGIEAVLAKGGSISGTVTDEQGLGLDGIDVIASTADESILPVTARSEQQGHFLLDGLPTGKYAIAFIDQEQRYYLQWYDGKVNGEEATPVAVSAPAATTGIKAVLRQAGGIAGRVTDADGNALADVMVFARSVDGSRASGNAETDETGAYTIPGLPSGSYLVGFRTISGPHLPRFYRNMADVRSAVPVEVMAPQFTFGIDQALPEGVFLAGRVTDSAGEPIPRTFIAAYPAGESSATGYAATEEDGTFSISLAEGEYQVEFHGRDGYLSRWYGGHADRQGAKPVVLSRERENQPLEVVLVRGGSLAGTVKDRAGKGIAEVRVTATNAATGDRGGSTTSEEGGLFRIEGLPSGLFTLTAANSEAGYMRQRLPQTVEITTPAGTEGIEIVLEEGGVVAGKVVDAAGQPLSNVDVAAYDPATWDEIADAATDAAGSYQVGGLPEGKYRIRFGKTGYRVQWFKGQARREDSLPVEVVGTAVTAGIDATLHPGVALTGVVTDADGAPLFGAMAEVYGDVEDEPFHESRTDFHGQFSIPALAPGSYRIRFSHFEHLPRWYGGNDRKSATPIVVTSNAPAVTVALNKAAGKVAGKLTSPEGEGVGQAWLTVIDAATGIAVADEQICECSGRFDIPLPVGRYQLRVERHGFVTWYSAPTREQATVIPVDGEVTDLRMIIGDGHK